LPPERKASKDSLPVVQVTVLTSFAVMYVYNKKTFVFEVVAQQQALRMMAIREAHVETSEAQSLHFLVNISFKLSPTIKLASPLQFELKGDSALRDHWEFLTRKTAGPTDSPSFEID
jgi:hypothetical protein